MMTRRVRRIMLRYLRQQIDDCEMLLREYIRSNGMPLTPDQAVAMVRELLTQVALHGRPQGLDDDLTDGC